MTGLLTVLQAVLESYVLYGRRGRETHRPALSACCLYRFVASSYDEHMDKLTRNNFTLALLALFLSIFLGACSKDTATEETMMKAGLDALYAHNDPNEAVAQFRKVLAQNPNHYGATFQLAMALERSNNAAEAQSVWRKMLTMADNINDKQTADMVRTHLGEPTVATSEATMMKTGLDALYTQHNPTEAIEQFRQVLARNPTHYGATFQLAYALDQAGKGNEARPLWEKVLQMAESSNDKQTADAARARLAKEH